MVAAFPAGAGEPAMRKFAAAALDGKDALVAGPGLGASAEAEQILRALLSEAKKREIPAVIDADALNLAAAHDDIAKLFPAVTIVTPHPGEMARLTKRTAADVESDRFGSARSLAARLRSTVVLKGAFTVIAVPNGGIRVSPYAQAVLATAGSGDVLAGMIGGFLAQGLEGGEACDLAVFVHGEAGNALSGGLAGRGVGALAHELADAVPAICSALLSWAPRPAGGFLAPLIPPQPFFDAHAGR
jgi:NAD(P)H-hydrate epimerase